MSVTYRSATSYRFGSLNHNSHLFAHSCLQSGLGSAETISLCCTWHQRRQAPLGLEEPHPWCSFTWLASCYWLLAGTQPSLWSRGFHSACVPACASSQHGVLVPRGKNQKLPALLNTLPSTEVPEHHFFHVLLVKTLNRASPDSRVDSLSSSFPWETGTPMCRDCRPRSQSSHPKG